MFSVQILFFSVYFCRFISLAVFLCPLHVLAPALSLSLASSMCLVVLSALQPFHFHSDPSTDPITCGDVCSADEGRCVVSASGDGVGSGMVYW